MKGKLLSHVRLLATPWTAAYQGPPSMEFSRQEFRSGVPLPSPRGKSTAIQSYLKKHEKHRIDNLTLHLKQLENEEEEEEEEKKKLEEGKKS